MSSDLEKAVHERLLAVAGGGQQAAPSEEELTELVRRADPLLGAEGVATTVGRVRARMAGVVEIERLLADPLVSDILVNGPGPVWTERNGLLARTEVWLDRDAIDLLIEKSTGPLGLRADRASPIVEARLADGSRLHVVLPPLAVDGPYVAIRRFAASALPLSSLCSEPVARLLLWAVAAGMNLVVCGGTGAGKTTLLNALCRHLPAAERVVTVEDAAELRLPGDHVVRLETRPASPDGLPAVSIRDLVRAALRLRPDRLIVGEVRGPEALDLLQALNTGHDGGLSTCHANGPADAVRRLETMASMADAALPLPAIREQLAAAVDLIVHVERLPDGSRAVHSVAEVVADPQAESRVVTLARDGRLGAPPHRAPRKVDGPTWTGAPGGSTR